MGVYDDLLPGARPAKGDAYADLAPPSSDLNVFANALMKGAAGVPDAVLNMPQNALNLGRAALGTGLTWAGRPDLAPDITPTPDITRRGMEALRLIRPEIVPQGAFQKGLDLVTQGAVGGALTGGGGIGTLVGAGLGATGAATAGATEALTGRPELGVMAGVVAPAGVARLASGGVAVRPDVRTLTDAGVSVTPGRILGGVAQRAEDALTSRIGIGDLIRNRQRDNLRTFNEAAGNQTLAPVGDRVPAGVSGKTLTGVLQDNLGARYDALYGNVRGALDGPNGGTLPAVQGAAPTLRQELSTIAQMGQNLPPPQRAQLNDIIKNEVFDRFTGHGIASGQTVQDISSKLGNLASTMQRSENYDIRRLGSAVKEAQAAVRRMVDNVNPQYAGERARLDNAYAQFKTIQDASRRAGVRDDIFTPAQLDAAVRSQDRSKDKSRYARGDALMQELSSAGRNVLSQTVPDSGAALRALLGTGVVGGIGYAANHPYITAGVLGTAGLAALPYTQTGARIAQALLTRPDNPLYRSVYLNSTPMALNNAAVQLMRED